MAVKQEAEQPSHEASLSRWEHKYCSPNYEYSAAFWRAPITLLAVALREHQCSDSADLSDDP